MMRLPHDMARLLGSNSSGSTETSSSYNNSYNSTASGSHTSISETHSDVVLLLSDGSVCYSHKAVLAVQSAHFARIFDVKTDVETPDTNVPEHSSPSSSAAAHITNSNNNSNLMTSTSLESISHVAFSKYPADVCRCLITGLYSGSLRYCGTDPAGFSTGEESVQTPEHSTSTEASN